jgi:hypothetical protein
MTFADWLKEVVNIVGSIGGVSAIIVWLANWWGNRIAERISNKERAQHEQELERLKTQLELTKSMVARYSEQQFAIYNTLWANLYKLRVAGDKLWECAIENNLQLFGAQLKATTEAVETGGLFIEDDHYQQLHNVLQTFASYETGKGRLIELRQGDYVGEYELRQITENRIILEEYSRLISEIRTSFREQLNVHVR